jgi:hypothetical protein
MPISPQITITPEDITTKNFDISAVTYTSTTATYTATGHTFSIGDIVLISDLAPDGYNGSFTITGTATNTFTVANTTNTAVTDAVGNAFWVDPTEYSYDNNGAVYTADSDDLAVITSALSTVETAVNGKNKIYRQSTAPSGSLVTGDIWFDTSSGNRQYYWSGSAWTDVQDTAIAAAAAAATAAQSTADGKNKVYRQGTTPSGTFVVGDLWFNTSSDNAISRWDGSSWVANALGNNALASISANKLNAGSIDASVITVSNINAGNISTGTLAAARIAAGSLDASKITANTITASQIAAGTITATQIAAGTITTDKLTAGTLTGYTVQTSSGAEAVILNGSSNAIQFKASSSVIGNMVPLNIGGSTYGIIMHYGASPDSSGATYPQSYVGSGSAQIAYSSGIYVSAFSSGVTIAASGQTITFANQAVASGTLTANGELYAAGHTTTGNIANGYVFATGGRIARSTASSQRYKENIVDLRDVPELDPHKLLDFKVRAFSYKENYLKNDDRTGVLIPGLIAEEVDAIYPLCADYADGQVENINDRAILINLLALVQEQDARIKALEGK